jgi:predicted amidohydrolase
MKVSAFQAPCEGSIDLVHEQVKRCELLHVEILCCPEALIGGLADYAGSPAEVAIEASQLDTILAPLASDIVTTIIGFTEFAESGIFYNSAAVFHRGTVIGIYRKRHPAIRRSVYTAGDELPVFNVNGLTFGILICNDSNFPELARSLVSQGAEAIFIPSNNALPAEKAAVVDDARNADALIAKENNIWVIRADVAGVCGERISYGSSGIVAPGGMIVKTAKLSSPDLIVSNI